MYGSLSLHLFQQFSNSNGDIEPVERPLFHLVQTAQPLRAMPGYFRYILRVDQDFHGPFLFQGFLTRFATVDQKRAVQLDEIFGAHIDSQKEKPGHTLKGKRPGRVLLP
jgi:hypothetical protein